MSRNLNLKTVASLSPLLLAAAACFATAGIAHAKTTSVTIADSLPPKTFVVVKKTPTGDIISTNELLEALRSMISENIGVRQLPSTPGFGPDVNSRAGINLDYDVQNGAFRATWKWAQALNHSYLSAAIPVHVGETGDAYRVTLECPSSMQSDIVSFSLVGIPKWPNDAIGKQLNAACSDSAAFHLMRFAYFKGEFNNQFNDSSIFANFERKATPISAAAWNTQRVSQLDLEKSKQFLVQIGSQQCVVSVAVFPYRNGSKVIYAYEYQYFLNSDGTISYNQAEAESVKSAILAIAND